MPSKAKAAISLVSAGFLFSTVTLLTVSYLTSVKFNSLHRLLMLLVALNLMRKHFCGIGAQIAVHGMEQLCGTLPERIFHLPNLKLLELSYNSQLTVILPMTKWNSSTSLMNLYLSSVKFNGTIPESMSYLTSLHDLDMSSGNLSGPILKPLWNLTDIENLSLENNNLEGTIYPFFKFGNLRGLRLWGNNFTSLIPSNVSGLRNLQSLYLSSNNLNGTIPSWISSLPSLSRLYLSDNHFKSQSLIVVTLKQNQLEVLDLGSNKLNGTIPQCLGEISGQVLVLELSNNRFSGTIKTTFSIGNQLSVIKLHGNKLEGKVPRSLINCKYLELLDLGDNELNDTFPKWLGTLPNLKLLSLRSNKLHGPIKASKNKKLFAQLQIMDLSSNGFSGTLPARLFENFQAMKIIDENVRDPWNRFEGYIPSIFGDLAALHTLNLSHNRLEGRIPPSLHQLSVLESLDLSFNKIGRGIPQQLAFLTSLEVLNLSHNHLVGCISKGKQFDTFELHEEEEEEEEESVGKRFSWVMVVDLSRYCL
ncbi:putative plastid-lipid-associated protein 12, chloroplastic-like isoform 1 [Capsicum annuum]|nr:putative plastid-lipid-associated protein 12, chloroplastic-like isoform 1 [Capsicum annuum]